jgi:hypothetical protein
MEITGKVVFVDLSGGFWGIEAEDGRQYCPVNGIPSRFRKKGLQVSASISPAQSTGIFMWGEYVNLKDISKL